MLKYWDRLAPGALVFDPNPPRAPTVFRPVDQFVRELVRDPAGLGRVGPILPTHSGCCRPVSAMLTWTKRIGTGCQPNRQALQGSCVRILDEERGSDLAFRRLLDLRDCR